ncbi:MAG TPA: penicillin-binding transpeptidase domain-containing protein [Acidimicrobiales bacterium]|nr:penicillin-binding transpeptidase domain-containing protein [Acidimicrobiales bacterium]
MKKQIRNLGVFLTLCYVVLFVQLNRYTVFDAQKRQDDPRNDRQEIRDFSAPRGTISTADGVLLANSVPSDDRYELQRQYPAGDLFAHVVGTFNPLSTGTSGVERTYNDELAGDLGFGLEQLGNLLEENEDVGNLTLTLRNDVQQAARDALGDRVGSVVALDPRNGAILAAWSNPTYDPAPLASHDFQLALDTATALDAAPDLPRRARWYRDNLPPGSTFKVVTATAGIEADKVDANEPTYPSESEFLPPNAGQPIENSNGDTCGGKLFDIFRVSCNTAFARMGTELSAEELVNTAVSYGFDQEVPIDLPLPAESTLVGSGESCPSNVDGLNDAAVRAQSAIGGRCVRSTPLQMALVAAAVANGGEVPKPHVMQEIRDNDGSVVDEYDSGTWTEAMDATTAGILRSAMIGIVDDGTARQLNDGLEAYEVGGKTGTAPLPDRSSSHAWIVGFAGPPNEEPQVAVAVVVEAAPGVGEQFGGQVAAPIASQVLQRALSPITPPSEQPTE